MIWVLTTCVVYCKAGLWLQIQEFGVTQTRELKPGGSNILVTEDNKKEYVKLVCQLKMTGAIRTQVLVPHILSLVSYPRVFSRCQLPISFIALSKLSVTQQAPVSARPSARSHMIRLLLVLHQCDVYLNLSLIQGVSHLLCLTLTSHPPPIFNFIILSKIT